MNYDRDWALTQLQVSELGSWRCDKTLRRP